MDYLIERGLRLQWIGALPENERIALLIPQYNECSGLNFEARLRYFKQLAAEHKDRVDVILIDDGSTDNSLAVMSDFLARNPESFYLASVFPNGNKVGALYLISQAISSEFIILSDFDTDIAGLDKLLCADNYIGTEPDVMGCYFRMLPFQGNGYLFLFQQVEYALQRCLYRFHKKEGSVRVMPGAGSCYKRDVLLSIYSEHSGLRSGEDREATSIGMKLGYRVFYMDNVVALTRPPLTRKALIRQRIRWNLGYLETFEKERLFYSRIIKKANTIGLITLGDIVTVLLILLQPLIWLGIGLINIYILLFLLGSVYVAHVLWCFILLSTQPRESVEFNDRKILAVMGYPAVKAYIEYFAWFNAVLVFLKKRTGRKRALLRKKPFAENRQASMQQIEDTVLQENEVM